MTVEEAIGRNNNLYKNFWEPLTLGILNTQCNQASAQILKNVVKETFLKGGKYSGIFQPKKVLHPFVILLQVRIVSI